MKKRLLSLALAFALLFALAPITPSAKSETIGDYMYTVEDGKATINYYSGSGGVVEIPSTLNGFPVTTVGFTSFSNCTSLTGVIIPNSVTLIGGWAFSGCSALTSVTIPNSVTVIGSAAFSGCSALTGITIPNSVTWIGDFAFSRCSALTGMTIPNSVNTVGQEAFYNCTSLTNVFVSDSVTKISWGTFYGCSALVSVNIPNSVTTIEANAFFGCSALTGVTLPDNVTTIGQYVFSGCSALTGVTIPDSVTTIGQYVFSGCSALTGVTIPDSVTTIETGVFSNCSSLTSMSIPNSVTSIDMGAFANCTSLTNVFIPNSSTRIMDTAFDNCPNLTIYSRSDSSVQFYAQAKQINFVVYAPLPFTDIFITDWFYGDINYVYIHELMTGTGTTAFSPNISLDRGMIVTMLYRQAGKPDVSSLPNPFSDVPEHEWYAQAVKWAYANGIINGTSATTYAPEEPILRQDLATILFRYNTKILEQTLPVKRTYPGFGDDDLITDYAKEAVALFYEAGIINGKSTTAFDPAGTATRAEAAAMLHRFLTAIEIG